ncbi:unnamed protein product, partial [Choristocarpus tenellus]
MVIFDRSVTTSPLADQFLSSTWPPNMPWHDTSGHLARDESTFEGRHICHMPGCDHRFSTSRHLALHLRVGH